jgi:hypothetical protein
MFTRRGRRSISSPRRAFLYRRSPPTFTAETIGGTCSISPLRSSRVRRRSASVTETARSETTSPDASCVDVTTPRRAAATYVFGASWAYERSRAARPTPITSTPVASGSRVPPWPTRLIFSSRRTFDTTSCEVMPAGLSTTRTPSCTGMRGPLKTPQVQPSTRSGSPRRLDRRRVQ